MTPRVMQARVCTHGGGNSSVCFFSVLTDGLFLAFLSALASLPFRSRADSFPWSATLLSVVAVLPVAGYGWTNGLFLTLLCFDA